ncbi:hypothetical protein GCM10025875_10720 [Litorihabitans aurantiacus]|uniref:Uncharacterized protein n=1 Tax=Litorihabitans aurantiacus TaxID=1930061 RepID=A0AA37XDE0_9MICO|nr:hypothetical protein GCM10025875_10720 [Litorihabitans aurantiacus]
MLEDDRAQRLERVRAALEQAETASGLRPVAWGRSGVAAAPVVARPEGAERVEAREEDEVAAPSILPSDASWLPAPPALAALLPHGAVRRGSALVVEGSTALLLHLTAALTSDGAWCALVSHPDLGLAAALDTGLDPARCALVPDPGPDAAGVLGALTDGFDVVVVGERVALGERDRRALAQRVRHRGAVLLSARPWPGSEVTLTVTRRAGGGLRTHGRLVSEDLTVTSSGRGLGAGRTRRVQIGRVGGVTGLVELPAVLPAAPPTPPTDLLERRAG